MSTPTMKTALEALEDAVDGYGDPIGFAAPFICPYPECGAYAQHQWGVVESLVTWPNANSKNARSIEHGVKLIAALCTACRQEVIFLNKIMIVPAVTQAPPAGPDLPESLLEDFEEARRVLPTSPRGAAALLRLVLQKLLPLIGANEGDINTMIGELVANGTVSLTIQQALDSVRVIGNEAVHPGVMDLKDDRGTAISLFKLINFIVEKAISEPKEVAAIFASLPPQKLAGIANRDKHRT